MTSQSDRAYPFGTADKAVDGNKNSSLDARSCFYIGMSYIKKYVIEY